MLLPLLAAFFAFAALALSVPILRFAFGRSVGTGFMVLLIPGYVFYFAVSQFEHRRKALVVLGWLGAVFLAVVWSALWLSAYQQSLPTPPGYG